jgi:glycosyltransferase involved in cell wall biosynthesis
MDKISVVVCVKNEVKKIKRCLDSLRNNNPDEIIVIDGDSSDATAVVANQYTKKVFISKNSNLTRDRQLGVNKCKNELIAMIDGDHILKKNDLKNLLKDLTNSNFDMVQSQIKIFKITSFYNDAENDFYTLFHNIPGIKKMIGVAPAIYKKRIFKKVNFNDKITKSIEDADFIYNLKKKNFVFGIGHTKISQDHSGRLKDYLKKFLWYGKGDGEFIKKNPIDLIDY